MFLPNMNPASMIALSLISVALSTRSSSAATSTNTVWPQFRGPNASGVSMTAKPPTHIGPTQSVSWKVALPWSPSSPIVWGDRLFVTTFENGELQTRAIQRRSGETLWIRGVKPEHIESFHRTDGSPAASTPAVDGAHVVSYFGSFGLLCHTVDGKELWRHPLSTAVSGGQYGSGTSPVIIGNKVLLNRDQDQGSSLLAVDVETGKTIWEAPRPEMTGGFATPILWNNEGVDEVVISGSVLMKGYDLLQGTERWVVEGTSLMTCTTPVLGDGMLFAASWSPGKSDSGVPLDWDSFLKRYDKNKDGQVDASDFDAVGWEFTRGLDIDRDGRLTETDLERIRNKGKLANNTLKAVRSGGHGNITATHIAWTANRGIPYVPSPLYYEGRVYLVKDGGMVSCFDPKTGTPFYLQERLGATGNYYASPVAADGKVYLASLAGKVTVVNAGGTQPEILHEADFGERIFATPAMVDREIFIRTAQQLYAFQDK